MWSTLAQLLVSARHGLSSSSQSVTIGETGLTVISKPTVREHVRSPQSKGVLGTRRNRWRREKKKKVNKQDRTGFICCWNESSPYMPVDPRFLRARILLLNMDVVCAGLRPNSILYGFVRRTHNNCIAHLVLTLHPYHPHPAYILVSNKSWGLGLFENWPCGSVWLKYGWADGKPRFPHPMVVCIGHLITIDFTECSQLEGDARFLVARLGVRLVSAP